MCSNEFILEELRNSLKKEVHEHNITREKLSKATERISLLEESLYKSSKSSLKVEISPQILFERTDFVKDVVESIGSECGRTTVKCLRDINS